MADAWKSKLDTGSVKFGANRAAMVALLGGIRAEEDVIHEGGGAKAAEAQRAKGRLTVRERLALLLDPGAEWMELGLWAAHGMYAEFGGAAGAIANVYYPASDRDGASIVIEQGLLGALGDGLGNVVQEFLFKKVTPHSPKYSSTTP